MPLSAKQQYYTQHRPLQLPEALRRDITIDYTQGFFFITLNVHDRLPILGQMQGQYEVATQQVRDAGVQLTKLGEAVQRCWMDIPAFHPNVQLLDAQVMPEHFHGLLHLDHQLHVPLGKIINGFMIGCTHKYWDLLGIDWKQMKGKRLGCADSNWTDWKHSKSLRGPSLFATGFNEVKPFEEQELENKIHYIHSNPERRIIKGVMRDCFTIRRNQISKNWTLERAKAGLSTDKWLTCHPDELISAWNNIEQRLLHDNQAGQLTLTYIGERELLQQRKLPLVCHRNDVGQNQEQINAVLREARKGAVIVSAFISRQEREIRNQLLTEGFPVIEILDNGMNEMYKPSGRSFYYCAEGKLLQITPWSYLYQRETSISRPMCMVMNELARVITGLADDWWK